MVIFGNELYHKLLSFTILRFSINFSVEIFFLCFVYFLVITSNAFNYKKLYKLFQNIFLNFPTIFFELFKFYLFFYVGAVTTIITLLQKHETRCAAVTMLGKTVELCLSLLSDKCDPAKLAELRMCLQTVRKISRKFQKKILKILKIIKKLLKLSKKY